ncbi:MAG TPA: hypothetical protein VFS43_21190 [Polyangiaceae bacterium]|nr:hypothetical protein [Polyangiaceae bacterium]
MGTLDAVDEDVCYEFKFTVCAEAYDGGDTEAVIDVEGEVLCREGHGDDTGVLRAGELSGSVLRVGWALNHRESLFDHCDAHSQTLHEIHALLFRERSYELRSEIHEELGGVIEQDVLVLDVIHVFPQHRGRGLGLTLAHRFIELFGRGCGVAVCKPFPLQFDVTYDGAPERIAQAGLDRYSCDCKLATAKLARHWGRLGFRRLLRGPYYALNLEHRLPALASLTSVR